MVLGLRLLSIEHVGSTSVPNLSSKNIVDILAGVVDRETADKCQNFLQKAGYDDVTAEDHPEWFYCLGKRLDDAYCHLHLVKEGSLHQKNHTTFRDWLRIHPEDAQAYAKLKITLAEKHQINRHLYTEAKADFITLMLEKANRRRYVEAQQY